MPLLYLAKVNLNSNIFEVYENMLSIDKICNDIYDKINNSNICYESKETKKAQDSLGNIRQYESTSSYMFQEIYKFKNEHNEKIITGKLVRTFDRASEEYDIKQKKMIEIHNDESVSIYFYYNVSSELIAFSERQSFGYNQFIRAFTYILNNTMEKFTFEIFLQKDEDVLQEKIEQLYVINKIKATLIPPNSNEDDLQELREELNYIQQFKDTNAIKVDFEYTSDNMNMESKTMQDIMKAVSRGYGDVTAVGKNNYGKKQKISSSLDAAYTLDIPDKLSKEEFNKESDGFIKNLKRKLRIKHMV